jgi:hypothetical protein
MKQAVPRNKRRDLNASRPTYNKICTNGTDSKSRELLKSFLTYRLLSWSQIVNPKSDASEICYLLYQSSFCPPLIAFCRALRASASPPARPPEAGAFWLEGVAVPLLPLAYPLSLGGVSRPGLRPAGRFAGGAGGVGFALAAPLAPGVGLAAAGAGGGGGRAAAGGGGGGACLTSSR